MTAINAVIVEMTEGFNKHDAVAASRMHTSDAEFTNVAGMTAKGAASDHSQAEGRGQGEGLAA